MFVQEMLKKYWRNPWGLEKTWFHIVPIIAWEIWMIPYAVKHWSMSPVGGVISMFLAGLCLAVVLYGFSYYNYVIVRDKGFTVRGVFYRFVNDSYEYSEIRKIEFVNRTGQMGYPYMRIYTNGGRTRRYFIELVAPDRLRPLVLDLQERGVKVEARNMESFLKLKSRR